MGYRNEVSIEAAIRSLLEQEMSETCEVVVVTSGGDSSAEIVRSLFPDIRVHESPNRLMPGGARNIGIGMANADIVGFLAADCIACPGWVEARLQAHRQGKRAVASAIVAPGGAGLADRAALYLLFPGRLPGHPVGPADHSQSFSLSFDAELLEQLGPFDGNLRVGEDSLMVGRLAKVGITAWFDPRICTAHPGPPTVGALLRDQFRRGGLRVNWEHLFKPAQNRRKRIEQFRSPIALGVGCALLGIKGLKHRLSWTARASWAGAKGERSTLLRCAPLMVLGVFFNQAGWATTMFRTLVNRDQLLESNPPAMSFAAPASFAEDALLRRWVSTSGERLVALTFDDGPGEDTTALLDELARLNVKATFFVLGDQIAKFPGVVRRAVQEGHVVGTHGDDHTPFTKIDPVALIEVGRIAVATLGEEIGQPVKLVRPPGGHYDTAVVEALGEVGLTTWLWTIDPRDWEQQDAGAISETVLSGLTPGAVVLMHDGPSDRSATVASLAAIVEGVRARGYRFVTLH